jgi:hypothetical protein
MCCLGPMMTSALKLKAGGALGVSLCCNLNNLRNISRIRNIRSLDVPISRFSQ